MQPVRTVGQALEPYEDQAGAVDAEAIRRALDLPAPGTGPAGRTIGVLRDFGRARSPLPVPVKGGCCGTLSD